MTIKPLRNMLFIERIKPAEEATTTSGIVVPVAGAKRENEGVVVFAGEESTIAIGTHVVFEKFIPKPVELDGKQYLACEDRDILAIIEP